MNDAMKLAWLEISQMVNVTTPEELDVFLRTWQRAIQAEREECAKACDETAKRLASVSIRLAAIAEECAVAVRARGQA